MKGVKVGFFSTARYEDGTPVAAVAAWNEFGTETIPERPFFRNALAESERGVSNILAKGIDTKKMVVDEQLAGRAGAYVVWSGHGEYLCSRQPTQRSQYGIPQGKHESR